MSYSPSVNKLIEIFSQFPGVGPRTAQRFAFYILKKKNEEIKALLSAIIELKRKTKFCSSCFNPFEPKKDFQVKCEICSDPLRDKSLLCIVATEIDLNTIEKTKKYKGLYFILGGLISNFEKINFEKLRFKELEKRIKESKYLKEIILAFNATVEGETTTLYLEKILKPSGIKITRLGRGLPVGGELEYADEETLESAFEGRK